MKKYLSFILIILLLISAVTLHASASDSIVYCDCGDHCEVSGYSGNPVGSLKIPATASVGKKKLPVTKIADFAFEGCEQITELILPKSVISVGEGAFSCCVGLKSVSVSEGLQTIGDDAFSGCTALSEISLPKSVKTVGRRAFAQCGGLISVELTGVSAIGDGAFAECTALSDISMSDSLRSVGSFAFSGCAELKRLCIPDGTLFVGEGVLRGCTALEGVIFPSSIMSLGDRMFTGCGELKKVYFKGSAEEWSLLCEGADGFFDGINVMTDFSGITPGDCNGDGDLNNKDIVILFRYVSGSSANIEKDASDFNADGNTDNKDVVALFRYVSSNK